MAIGGVTTGNRYVERFSEDGNWNEIGTVNVGGTDKLYGYSTVTTNGYLYIFGKFNFNQRDYENYKL